jgi:hypothetical protein
VIVTLVWLPALAATIGIAILRYRLYDIDRLINRTLVYGLLTAILGSVYAAIVLVLGQLFGGIGDNPPSWAVAGATLSVAALFQPARHRIQAVVDRASIAASTTRPRPSRRSAPACATRSTWTAYQPSCWPSPTKPCSQRRLPYGSGQRHRPSRVVNDEEVEPTPTRFDPLHAIYGPSASSRPIWLLACGSRLSAGYRD